ncbi:hypothetical protein D3C76_1739780 [compost metagenome]
MTHRLLQLADRRAHHFRGAHALDPAVVLQAQALTGGTAGVQPRLTDLTQPLSGGIIAHMAGVTQHFDALQVSVEQRTAR